MFHNILANHSPVYLLCEESFQAFVQYPVRFGQQIGVFVQNILGYITRILKDLSIGCQVRDLKVYPFSALTRPSRSPWPRRRKSASAISNPLLLLTIISKRLRVSLLSL